MLQSEPTRIVGESKALMEALSLARRLATTDLPILLVGETGTGKELFADELHRWSRRRGPLVDVNCGALPRDMIEGLLFGHRRGSFTGAVQDTKGLIESADGGTFFLDELGSLPLEAQPKLLRTIESGTVRRIGETLNRSVQVRYVAAAHPDFAEEVKHGGFRDDLLQRVAGAIIWLPPLRERGDDVRLLAAHFASLRQHVLSDAAADSLLEYEWPGNARELRLVVDRASHLSDSRVISRLGISAAMRLGASALSFGGSVRPRIELPPKERVLEVCAQNDWNASKTAHALGLGRTTLFKELKSLGISLRDVRSNAALRAKRITGGGNH